MLLQDVFCFRSGIAICVVVILNIYDIDMHVCNCSNIQIILPVYIVVVGALSYCVKQVASTPAL